MMKRLRVFNSESFDESNQPRDDIVLILEAWSAGECENDIAAEAFSSHASNNSRISQYFLRMDDTQNGVYTSEGAQAEATALLECILELRRHDINKPPILFLGQGFGGILLKQALAQLPRTIEELNDIWAHMRTTVFVCTLGRWQDENDLKKTLRQILTSQHGMEDTKALHHLQGLADVVIEANNAFHESKASLGDIYSVLPSDSTMSEASIFKDMCRVYHPLEILGMTTSSSGEMMKILANSTPPIFRSERDQQTALSLNPYLQAALSYAAPQPPFPYITGNTTDGVSDEAWLEWIHSSVYRLGDEDLFRICVCTLKDNLSVNKNLTALFVLNNLDTSLTWQTQLVKRLHEAFQDSQLRLKVLITSPRIDLVRESLGFAQELSLITTALAPVSSKIIVTPESDETSPKTQELQSIDITAWHIIAKYHPPLQDVRSKLASLAPWLRKVTYRWIEENSNHTSIQDMINDFLSSTNDYSVIRIIFNSFSEKKFLAMSVMTIILWAGTSSALSILAQYGLLSAIEVVIGAARGQQVSEENLAAAFTAAAASGHLKVVRVIAQQAKLQRYDADKAVLAAIESRVDEVLEEVIEHCTRTGQVFSDVAAFLARAASLDSSVAIKIVEEKVIKHKSLDDSFKSSFPLGLACYTKTPDILHALLRLGISPPINHTESWQQPLDIICRYGSSALIEPFLNHLKSVHAPDSRFLASICLESLNMAEKYGQSAVISCILDWASRNELVLINDNVDSWTVFLSVPKYIKLLTSPILRPDKVTSEDTAFKKLLYAFLDKMVIEVVQELLQPPITIDEDVFCDSLVKAGYCENEKLVNIVCSVGARSGIDINSPLVKNKVFTSYFIELITANGLMVQLLENKFDPNMEIPSLKRSILGYAAYCGNFEVVRALLAAGAKVEVGGDDWTPLHCAYDSPEITTLLLKYGADVNSRDNQNLSALYFASKWGCCEVVEAILEKMPRRDTLEQALRTALGNGQTNIAKILIDHDPDLTVESSDAREWLRKAASRSGGAAHIQLILGHCRNLDFVKSNKWPTTMMLRISPSTEVSTIRTLAANGADVNVLSPWRRSPLWYAASADNLGVARCLVRWGAKINSSENDPLALNEACRKASPDFVRFLLDEGAEVNTASNADIPGTPLHSALIRNEDGKNIEKTQIIDCLLSIDGINVQIKSRTWGSALSPAAMNCKLEVVTRLLEMGAVANESDHLGREPIHFALLQSVDMAELLLREEGVTLDGRDKIGRHALHFAVQSRRLDVIKFVLHERPQFVNEPDIHGWTPLLWALRSLSPICVRMSVSEDQLKDILELLINGGASKFVKGKGANNEFWTPVKLASYHGLDVLEMVRPSPEELKRCDDEFKDLWYEECDRHGTDRPTAYCDLCLAV
ncbi:ankyrin repeat-containing domain protein [Trichoderma pleuroticola]